VKDCITFPAPRNAGFYGRWAIIGTYCVVSRAYLPFLSAGWTNDFFPDRQSASSGIDRAFLLAVIVKERCDNSNWNATGTGRSAKSARLPHNRARPEKPAHLHPGFAREIQERKGDPAEDAAAINRFRADHAKDRP
jgi:hypothetical protein